MVDGEGEGSTGDGADDGEASGDGEESALASADGLGDADGEANTACRDGDTEGLATADGDGEAAAPVTSRVAFETPAVTPPLTTFSTLSGTDPAAAARARGGTDTSTVGLAVGSRPGDATLCATRPIVAPAQTAPTNPTRAVTGVSCGRGTRPVVPTSDPARTCPFGHSRLPGRHAQKRLMPPPEGRHQRSGSESGSRRRPVDPPRDAGS